MLKTILKNILENQQIFTQLITIHFMLQLSVEASTWDLEGILTMNGTVLLNSYST